MSLFPELSGSDMAASALRLGCKILQQDAWKLRVVYPTVSLCTKSGKPKKEPTKNVVAPEKKAKVQVDKYAPSSHLPAGKAGEVAVPKTYPDAAPSGPEKGIAQFSTRRTSIEFPLRAAFSAIDHTAGAVAAAGDQLKKKKTRPEPSSSSSSSSSESDSSSSSSSSSSSDSEDEGDVLQIPVKTKVDFPTRGSGPTGSPDTKQTVVKQQKSAAGPEKHSSDVKQRDSPKITKAAGSALNRSVSSPTDAKAKSVISKPSLEGKSTTSGTKANDTKGGLRPIKIKVVKKGSKAAISQESHGAKEGPPSSSEVRSPGIGPAQSLSGKVTQDSFLPGASNAEPERTIQSEETVLPLHAAVPEMAAEVPWLSPTPGNTTGTGEHSTMETADPSMISGDTTGIGEPSSVETADPSMTPGDTTGIGEPSTMETADPSTTPADTTGIGEPGTGETADPSTTPETEAGAAAQDEPFDNSTYRNLQHHSFTPYTFLDVELELAKFRLPQPSSGRPSPRH